MKILNLIILASVALLYTSCKDDDDNIIPSPDTTNGVFVVNEGSFGAGNGSVSYLSLTTGVMTNNLFENVNGFPLGDVAQSMTIHNGHAYVIVNNSQKVEVLKSTDFTSLHTIGGLMGPRYMVAAGNKGYISDWFANEIKVVDLTSHTITKSIPVGNGPEQMAIIGNVLFVTNVGGFGMDSTVSIINLTSETNVGTLQVGTNPNSIVTDANGKMWVLCGGSTGPDYIGGTADDIAGSLYKINPLNFTTEMKFEMATFMHPVKLQTNGTKTDLYFLAGTDGYTGKIMKLDINATTLNPLLFANKEFYGLGIDPVSGIVYGGNVPGFTQNGYIFRYSTSANLVDSMEVGIAPNWFTFN